jgi:glyoxylase-like metal-dependent hydrolase (beta-lactamase superfamily II)
MTGPGTNTYLVGRSEVAVVDPGPEDEGHRAALLEAVAARGGTVRWILVTHTHPDHAPGAAALAAATGATVVGAEARDGFVPDLTAADGTEIGVPDRPLRALATPGHASDHLCWWVAPEGVLLTGDHLMEGSTVVIRPPDGDMAAYLDSLALVAERAPSALAPGHGRVIADPAAAVAAVVAHRRAREAAVARALEAAGRARVDDLLHPVYPEVAAELLPVARFSLWAHLRHLAAQGACAPQDLAMGQGDDLETCWAWGD